MLQWPLATEGGGGEKDSRTATNAAAVQRPELRFSQRNEWRKREEGRREEREEEELTNQQTNQSDRPPAFSGLAYPFDFRMMHFPTQP
jgi:hypothetical protein